jgi:hypothetical protein
LRKGFFNKVAEMTIQKFGRKDLVLTGKWYFERSLMAKITVSRYPECINDCFA